MRKNVHVYQSSSSPRSPSARHCLPTSRHSSTPCWCRFATISYNWSAWCNVLYYLPIATIPKSAQALALQAKISETIDIIYRDEKLRLNSGRCAATVFVSRALSKHWRTNPGTSCGVCIPSRRNNATELFPCVPTCLRALVPWVRVWVPFPDSSIYVSSRGSVGKMPMGEQNAPPF